MPANSSDRRLTTGEAAKLCSVERDTVLKWIRRGRLRAERTAGGHFRIDPQELKQVAAVSAAKSVPQHPMRCWEYLADYGKVREECRRCIAYHVGAAWCFEMRQQAGKNWLCCSTESCEDCAYYRRAKGLSTRVLVVTEDENLLDHLRGESGEELALCFVRNGYEAATAVGRFRPGFVVVDEEADRGGGADLVQELGADSRNPGMKIVYAVSPRHARQLELEQLGSSVVVTLPKPFGLSELQAVVERYPVENQVLTLERGSN